ncbi:glucose/galactose MFS transporter [Sphingobacterium rhinopitheci]|uniref:glucose/galactose MFS transporter n=1 Tax=Sphingobacterium rhinopitheci TaxID=2781960 RepID=UPI001F527FF6|nr:glucose/galactose MFS transporter [Sphingobacterium rhinopitheci]MCI0921031.1 glucose/galactose MFS transporter [Sphingobacterium rhinopitheci]
MSPSSQPQKTAFLPMAICCLLFFILGFFTWANGALIPFVKLAFSLQSDLQAFFVLFASYIAYFFLALPSSWILKKTGFDNGLVLSLVLLAVGSLIFIPAAHTGSYQLFLLGIFVQGSAMALLQTAVNPYLSIIGPIESAAQRISIAGVFNKGAGIIVPFVLGGILLKGSGEISEKIQSLPPGPEHDALLGTLLSRVDTLYIILAVVVLLFAVVIKVAKMPPVDVDKEDESESLLSAEDKKKSIFDFPHLFLGALAIFFCVAVEVMAGDIIGTYGKELSLPEFFVKYGTAFTLACMLVGYFIGIATIPKFISQQMALRLCTIVGISLTVAATFTTGITSYIFIALLGVANSLMWPAIFPLGIKGLGKFTKTGSAIMIMGIAGGAIWPLIYGYLKDTLHVDFQDAFLYAVVPAYLYILYFGAIGHKVGKKD